MCALSNAKCMHLLPSTMYCAYIFASIRILYMPPGSQCLTLNPNVAAYALASLRHYRFPLLSLLQRLHVRVAFLNFISAAYVHSPIQILLPYRSYIRSLHSLRLSHASYSICVLNGFVTNCRERIGTQGQDPVADSALLLALPSNQTIFHVHSQVECPAVHDRATRCVSFFHSIPSLHLLILLHSCLRCRHHRAVLRSPVRGEILDTICECIYRSHRLCFHLGRPHGFGHFLRPDPRGAPGSPTTRQVPVH